MGLPVTGNCPRFRTLEVIKSMCLGVNPSCFRSSTCAGYRISDQTHGGRLFVTIKHAPLQLKHMAHELAHALVFRGDKLDAMSSIAPQRFTGVSSFSADFQAILTRATQIASVPIQQLQNQQGTLLSKKQSVASLNSNLQGLTDAVENLGELGRTRAVSLSSSNSNKVSVTSDGLSTSASYTITQITSVAKASSETTLTGLATADATPVDSDNALELVLAGQTYALDLTAGGNNLNSLAAAINASGAAVRATVLNTGNGNYLSVTANSPGEQALQVRTTAGEADSNLLTATNQGANARFKLNGLDVVQTDNVISGVVPGLTFTILGTTAVDETITVAARSNRGDLATGLGAFVRAYNATRGELQKHIGETAGLLSGDYLIGEAGRTLHKLTGYQADGGVVKSLSDLGIEADKTGVLSFNSTKFYALGTAAVEGAFDFLGSKTTGFGRLSATVDQLSNPISGLLRTQQDSYDASDRRIQKQVDDITLRIERFQSGLTLKLQQADALLASLQSQQTSLEASLKAVNFATYGKN